MTSESLDAVLDLLAKDGLWHTINEISTLEPLRRIPITTLMNLLNFLEEFDFIEGNNRMAYDLALFVFEAKIDVRVDAFWKKIKLIEGDSSSNCYKLV